jgi:hypothetical protein
MSETTQSSLCSLTDSIDDDLIPRDSLLPGQQQHLHCKYRKFEANIPRKGIARPQYQFPHFQLCQQFYFCEKNKQESNLEKENSPDLGPQTGFNESGSAILQCNGNPSYIFPEKEWPGLNPNFHIHVSVSDLYISTIGLLQENMRTNPGNI